MIFLKQLFVATLGAGLLLGAIFAVTSSMKPEPKKVAIKEVVRVHQF